jgi:hypothetical protein
MSFELKLPFERIPALRPSYNVGAGLDIPTGTWLRGKYGESILNGGAGALTGFVGIGNQYKTTMVEYEIGQIFARYIVRLDNGQALSYDTESNKSESRLSHIVGQLEGITPDNNPVTNAKWIITDKGKALGDEFHEQYKQLVADKLKNRDKLLMATPFLDRDGSNFKDLIPTPVCVDSMSEFETTDVADMKEENALGEKGGNTIFMRQGLAKMRMFTELPRLIDQGNTPYFMTAHIGKYIAMDPHAPQPKKLQFLKNGDVVKGVSDKFFFSTTAAWQCTNASPYNNDGSKGPEYPADSSDNMKMDTDLMSVTITLLRNKYGRSGLTHVVMVSQELGVLPSLTEFHYIKTVDRFGFATANTQNYELVLCPEIKLSRTTIRTKIAKHPELRRALNILSEMLQTIQLTTDKEGVFCTPQQLHDDLVAMGYDWPTLLATRGWWTYDNDKHPVPFLSSMDLLRMRRGLYVPYWWPKDKKPIDLTKAK